MNYMNFRTEELISQVEEIATVLKDRLWKENMSQDVCDIIETLIYTFRLNTETTRYALEIITDGEYRFYTQWRTPEKTHYKFYRNCNNEEGLPDVSLLEKTPIKWMENLLLGVYNVEEWY